jgi:hypothetical protein
VIGQQVSDVDDSDGREQVKSAEDDGEGSQAGGGLILRRGFLESQQARARDEAMGAVKATVKPTRIIFVRSTHA